MKIPIAFLESKVARRIVLLFVSCALLPVTILGVVSFYEVSSQLREESQKQLTQASKRQGMAIYERLEMLESDLQLLSSQVREHRSLATQQTLPSHFSGGAVFTADGNQGAHWGNAVAFPRLSSAERQHLLSGNSLLQVSPSNDGTPDVFMLRMLDAGGSESLILVGEPDPDYLWTTKSLSPDLQFCVLSASRSVLFCSDDSMRSSSANAFPAFSHASGSYQWKSDHTLYDSSYWKLLVKPKFLQESWTIAVSQEHADVLAPMVRFRRIFPLVMLLTLWIVLLSSMIQIRRTLGPLEKLQDGTRKIGARQFGSRVEVHSGDEFEGLATSFNLMAAQLGRQFHTLRTIHEIDQAIFASVDREAIVDGVLAHMSSLLPSDTFGVCLFDDTRSSGWTRFREVETGHVQTEITRIAAAEWLQLQNTPASLTVVGEEGVPGYLLPLSQRGMRSFLVLPIRVDNSLQAALVCARGVACRHPR